MESAILIACAATGIALALYLGEALNLFKLTPTERQFASCAIKTALVFLLAILIAQSISTSVARTDVFATAPSFHQRNAVCPGPEIYRFPERANKIKVIAKTDCWSGWVVTPAGSSYRIDHDDGMIAYLFVNGDFFRRGKNEVSYFGVLRGIFRVRSEEPFSQEVTITVTR